MQADLTRQEQVILDIEKRLATAEDQLRKQQIVLERLEQSTPDTTPTPSRSYYPAPPDATTDQEESVLSPTEVYLQAFGDYASGRYQVAVQGFQNFLQRFPNNSYASNAQYWLADAYYNQQQYNLAIAEYRKVLDNYPRAPKSPDALLRIASAHLQLGNSAEALQTIETLKRRYPENTAASKADELTRP